MIPATLPAPAPATDAKTVGTGGDGDVETTFAHVLGQMFVLGAAGEETPDHEAASDGSMGVPAEAIADPGTTDPSTAVVALGAESEGVMQGPSDGDADHPSSDRVADRRGLAVAQANAAEPARLVTAPPGPTSDRSGQQTRSQAPRATATPTGGSQPVQPSAVPSTDAFEVPTSPAPSQGSAETRPRPVAGMVAAPTSAESPTATESASSGVSIQGEVAGEVEVEVDGEVDGEVDTDVAKGPATEAGEEAGAVGQRTMANNEDGDTEQRPTRRGPSSEATRAEPSAAPTTPEASSPSVDRAHGATATATAATAATAASDTAAPADAPMPVNAPAPPATVTATVAPAAPVQAPAPVPAQIVDHVTPLLQKGDGTHEVTIELDPVDLGRVRLEITLDDGVVSVRVHADDPATRRLLASSMHELRASLTEAGVSAGDLDVRDGDIDGRDRRQAGERSPRDSVSDEGRAPHGDRPRPRASSRSALDVLL